MSNAALRSSETVAVIHTDVADSVEECGFSGMVTAIVGLERVKGRTRCNMRLNTVSEQTLEDFRNIVEIRDRPVIRWARFVEAVFIGERCYLSSFRDATCSPVIQTLSDCYN